MSYITIARLPLDLAGPQADERRGWRLLRPLGAAATIKTPPRGNS